MLAEAFLAEKGGPTIGAFAPNALGLRLWEATNQIATAPNRASNIHRAAFLIKALAEFQISGVPRRRACTRLFLRGYDGAAKYAPDADARVLLRNRVFFMDFVRGYTTSCGDQPSSATRSCLKLFSQRKQRGCVGDLSDPKRMFDWPLRCLMISKTIAVA